MIRIFESEDIMKCFNNISNREPKFQYQFDQKDFEEVEIICFDKRDKHLALASKT